MDNKKIRKFLIKIGISANLQGHFYILDCVEILNKQRIHTNLMTLYEMIGKKYDKNNTAIERTIRHSITQAYHKTNILKNIYGFVPDNSVLIYDLVFNFDILEGEIKL